jgi:hypothetical protein
LKSLSASKKIRHDYANYDDISNAIQQPFLPDLLESIDKFQEAILKLPEPLPSDYENKIRLLAGRYRGQLDAALRWINQIRSLLAVKKMELEGMR